MKRCIVKNLKITLCKIMKNYIYLSVVNFPVLTTICCGRRWSICSSDVIWRIDFRIVLGSGSRRSIVVFILASLPCPTSSSMVGSIIRCGCLCSCVGIVSTAWNLWKYGKILVNHCDLTGLVQFNNGLLNFT